MISRCAYPGCGRRIGANDGGRCWLHPRSFARKRKQHGKQYGGAAWKRARDEAITTYPLCLLCHLKGLLVPAVEVDHIDPLHDGSDREQLINQDGLAPLCKSHHSWKTAKIDPYPDAVEQYRQQINEAKRSYQNDYSHATEEEASQTAICPTEQSPTVGPGRLGYLEAVDPVTPGKRRRW